MVHWAVVTITSILQWSHQLVSLQTLQESHVSEAEPVQSITAYLLPCV